MFSLVIFEIFTVNLAAAAKCTEFLKLEGTRALRPHSKRRRWEPM